MCHSSTSADFNRPTRFPAASPSVARRWSSQLALGCALLSSSAALLAEDPFPVSAAARPSVMANAHLHAPAELDPRDRTVSDDGRYAVFVSSSENFATDDTNRGFDVFLRDTLTNQITLVSHSVWSPDEAANNDSADASISADGNTVVYWSNATDLTFNVDLNEMQDVFFWDRVTGINTLVSKNINGEAGNSESHTPVVSADGNRIGFLSRTTDLTPNPNNATHAYVWHRSANQMTRIDFPWGDPLGAANGNVEHLAMSASGERVAFASTATNMVSGTDTNSGLHDIFLWEEGSGSLTLVSGSTPGTTANAASRHPRISADGSLVVFESNATNLMSVVDANGPITDLFAFDIDTGDRNLVSHAVGNPLHTANAASYDAVVNAEGSAVAFVSQASDLVTGPDLTNTQDVFHWDRATNGVSLVSRTFGDAAAAGNGESDLPAISADGQLVALASAATDLVNGIDDNNARDVFVWRKSNGAMVLVSHRHGAALVASNGASDVPALPASHGSVLFESTGADLLAEGSARGVYRFDVSSTLVSGLSLAGRSGASTANSSSLLTQPIDDSRGQTVSDDGRYVAFTSLATDLVEGFDANAGSDVFLLDRSTGSLRLVSHVSSSAVTTGDRAAWSPCISGDGAWVGFLSDATNLVAPSDTAAIALFVWSRQSGNVLLASHLPSDPTAKTDGAVVDCRLSADGSFAAFESTSSELVAGTMTFNRDIYLWERSSNTNRLVSHTSNSTTTSANGSSSLPKISADGRRVLFTTSATNVGGSDANGGLADLFLWDRLTNSSTLVSHTATDPTMHANQNSRGAVLSADGDWVAFRSLASDLVSGFVDNNVGDDVFLWDRQNRATRLVSHAFGSATTSGDRQSSSASISSDGRFVAYQSQARDLTATFEPNIDFDVFSWSRDTGINTLVSHVNSSPLHAGDGGSTAPVISADGGGISFMSLADHLDADFLIDDNQSSDVLLWNAATNEARVVSRSTVSPPQTADGPSKNPTLSADGQTVVFESEARTLVSGFFDDNVAFDVYGFSTASLAADIELSVVAAPDVGSGGTIAYAAQVENLNGNDAVRVALFLQLPPEATFLSSSGAGWSCESHRGRVSCLRENLPGATAAPLLFVSAAGPLTAGTAVAEAYTNWAGHDPELNNNSISTATVVREAFFEDGFESGDLSNWSAASQ